MTTRVVTQHPRRRASDRGLLRIVWDHITGRCIREARRKVMDTNERNREEIEQLLARARQQRENAELTLEKAEASLASVLNRKERR